MRRPRAASGTRARLDAELLHDELQILPGLSLGFRLLWARAQKVGRMVRRHHDRVPASRWRIRYGKLIRWSRCPSFWWSK